MSAAGSYVERSQQVSPASNSGSCTISALPCTAFTIRSADDSRDMLAGLVGADGGGDGIDLGISQLRIHRQRQYLACRAFGFRELAFVVPEIAMRGLHVDGNRIVQPRLDALGLQTRLQVLTLIGAHGVHVVDVPAIGARIRRLDLRADQARVVAGGVVAAGLGPRLEMPQLHAENRALQALHPVVEALVEVVVP